MKGKVVGVVAACLITLGFAVPMTSFADGIDPPTPPAPVYVTPSIDPPTPPAGV